ncbi:polymorphic toxin type 46 domain-containing protein [Chitiniphilus shinanonensis]|uniref:polymorphic toxin type 46 domain-containing protein n=1 Tax=Chitiniphilus shinanonensis TaxID=553088 RepID=UPI001B7FE5BA
MCHTSFTPTTPVKALQSTAADILDTWTVPNQSYMTKVGGLQYFVPNKGIFMGIPNP